MRAPICDSCVVKANAQFWEQMLAMTIDPAPHPAEFFAPGGHLVGSVELSGVWAGTIEVRMTEGLAYLATGAMTMLPVEEVSEADTLDATREITNMIAGTIKSCLPRPCSMTVPESAVLATEFRSHLPTEDEMTVVFCHEAGQMLVTVHEREFAG